MKWVKRLILPVAIVAVVAGTLIQKWFQDRADGTIVIFAPVEKEVKANIDGLLVTIPPGGFYRFHARHGMHLIDVPNVIKQEVMVKSGREVWGVPTRRDMCFEEQDVTLSHYGSTAGKEPPKVARAFILTRPFHLPVEALDESELPKSASERVGSDGKIKSMQLVFLFKAMPCRDLKYDTRL
jgi:hypothetical protein